MARVKGSVAWTHGGRGGRTLVARAAPVGAAGVAQGNGWLWSVAAAFMVALVYWGDSTTGNRPRPSPVETCCDWNESRWWLTFPNRAGQDFVAPSVMRIT